MWTQSTLILKFYRIRWWIGIDSPYCERKRSNYFTVSGVHTKICKNQLFCLWVEKLLLIFLENFKKLFIWAKSFHPAETSHLGEISTEWWYVSLCKNKSFIWELIYATQVRSHFNVDEISLRWDNIYSCKQFLPGCPS